MAEKIQEGKYKVTCGKGSDIVFWIPQCNWPIEMLVDGNGQGLAAELGVNSLGQGLRKK